MGEWSSFEWGIYYGLLFWGSMLNSSSIYRRKNSIFKFALYGLLNFDTVGYCDISMDFVHFWTMKCVLSFYYTMKNPIAKICWLKRLEICVTTEAVCNGPRGKKGITHSIAEYVKFANIEVVHVLGSIEDERCFSSSSFLKNKLHNSLEEHLLLSVGMYSQKLFTLEGFPYDITFDMWVGWVEHMRYGV